MKYDEYVMMTSERDGNVTVQGARALEILVLEKCLVAALSHCYLLIAIGYQRLNILVNMGTTRA